MAWGRKYQQSGEEVVWIAKRAEGLCVVESRDKE